MVGRWGETGHTGYTRSKQHLEALKTARYKEEKADLESGIVACYLEYHKGEEHQFKMDIVQKLKNPMQRQIAEEVNIRRNSDHLIMNSKSE